MSPLAAAVVLLWALVIVLAFAVAGLKQQVRTLETRPRPSTSGNGALDAVAAVAPVSDKPRAAVMVVRDSCGVCEEMLPEFLASAERAQTSLEHVVLAEHDIDLGDSQVRLVADPEVHASLEPGWFPALLIVTSELRILAAEPVGSPDALRAALDQAASVRSGDQT